MKLKNIKDPWIAKEQFSNVSKVNVKLNYSLWVEFVENNLDYFTWLENTEKGKKTLAGIDKVPESFRKDVLKSHNKMQAYAEFNEKKGYHEIIVQFNERLGVIGTTFHKPVKKEHLQVLLELAKHLDALLLNNGNEIIDEEFINSLT